mgnify:FL=1
MMRCGAGFGLAFALLAGFHLLDAAVRIPVGLVYRASCKQSDSIKCIKRSKSAVIMYQDNFGFLILAFWGTWLQVGCCELVDNSKCVRYRGPTDCHWVSCPLRKRLVNIVHKAFFL